ncbi:hypothetical protein [Robiginitalea sp.]|uniref:hypothetical protein n=1 Tax=Robiginitalea sp. TaxID=1902411 RepID=UPI003C7704FC
MAPVDFEKELQDRLRSREVQPREDSWDRIEARLETEFPARKPGSRKWKFLAAASVVFLLGYFLLQESAVEVPPTDVVVESPDSVVPEAQNVPESGIASDSSPSDSPQPLVVTDAESQNPMDRNIATDKAVTGGKNEPLPQPDLTDRALAGFTPDIQDDLKIPDAEWGAPDSNLEDGLDDAEVEALLAEALLGVENSGVPTDTTSLNPAALLGEVESELDQTFREQILKKLKTGFSKVRTAVADRSE